MNEFEYLMERVTNLIVYYIAPIRTAVGMEDELPNIAITFRTKLTFVYQQFKKSGIELKTKDKNGVMQYSGTTHVSIIYLRDLLGMFIKAYSLLIEYAKTLPEIEKFIKDVKAKTDNAKTLMEKCKKIIITSKGLEAVTITFNELEKLIDKYKQIDSELWKYGFETLAYSIIQELIKSNMPFQQQLLFFDKIIAPDLILLGQPELVSEIKERLISYQGTPNNPIDFNKKF